MLPRHRLASVFLLLGAAPLGAACSPPPVTSDAAVDARDAGDVHVTPCTNDLDCTDNVFCNGAERCAPGAANADARGCVAANPATPCMPTQTCDEAMQRCATACTGTPDADGDGHRAIECGGDDCDDSDPNRFPGNSEVCEWDATNSRRIDPTHDEDCNSDTVANPTTLDGDQDHDTYIDVACCNARRAGGMTCGNDCADTAPVMGMPAQFMTTVAPASIHPTQIELCNGIDDNCSGAADEGLAPTAFYPDCDGDGFGDGTATPQMACGPDGVARCSTNTAVTNTTDCDDTHASVHLGATEACNGLDDNCDGTIDEDLPSVPYYRDCDGDGFGDAVDTGTMACAPGIAPECMMHAAVSMQTDCDDTRDTIHPGTSEVCNGRDEDCNGRIDTGCPATIDLSGTTYTSTLLGSDTSGDMLSTQRCPAGTVVVGFDFHTSAGRIDGIAIKCQTPTPTHTGDPYTYGLGRTGSLRDYTPVAGTGFGTYTTGLCPAGYVGRGFDVNNFVAGTFGSPGMVCVQRPVNGAIATWTIGDGPAMTIPFTIGNGTVCTGNDLMVGANFYWDSTSVHGIQVICLTGRVGVLP